MKKIAIFGAGGFGREVLELVRHINKNSQKWDFIGFFDDGEPKGEQVNGYPILGNTADLNSWQTELHIVLALGNPKTKKCVYSNISNPMIFYPTLIHPSAILGIKDYINIGDGCVVCAGTIITTNVDIGAHVILNLSCTVGHDVNIGNFSSLMPACNISGEVTLGECNYWGTGAKIINGKTVGRDVTVGAGAVVVTDIPDHATAVGVPAKVIKLGNG